MYRYNADDAAATMPLDQRLFVDANAALRTVHDDLACMSGPSGSFRAAGMAGAEAVAAADLAAVEAEVDASGAALKALWWGSTS